MAPPPDGHPANRWAASCDYHPEALPALLMMMMVMVISKLLGTRAASAGRRPICMGTNRRMNPAPDSNGSALGSHRSDRRPLLRPSHSPLPVPTHAAAPIGPEAAPDCPARPEIRLPRSPLGQLTHCSALFRATRRSSLCRRPEVDCRRPVPTIRIEIKSPLRFAAVVIRHNNMTTTYRLLSGQRWSSEPTIRLLAAEQPSAGMLRWLLARAGRPTGPTRNCN